MSTLQVNRREIEDYENYHSNKENENLLNKFPLHYKLDKNKKISKFRHLDKFSSGSLKNYLDSVALQLREMGSKIHPINFQPFHKEAQNKHTADGIKKSSRRLKNLNKSHSEKLIGYSVRKFDSHAKFYVNKDLLDDLQRKDNQNEKIIKNEPLIVGESEKSVIIDIILAREKSATLIQKFYRKTYAQKKAKLVYLLEKILKLMKPAIIKIQSHIKGYFCRRNIRQIIKMKEENYLILFYKKEKEMGIISKIKIRDLYMIVKQDKYNQVLNFKYNRFLNCFILFIRKNESYMPKYKILFIINGQKIVDILFEIVYEEDGSCYNILDFTILKKRGYVSNMEEHIGDDCIQLMVRRKLTLDTVPTVADKEIENDKKLRGPCIKKSSDSLCHRITTKKKVSFNLRANNFY